MAGKAKRGKPITIRTRLSPDLQERFFERAKAQNRQIADLLQEAVSFYLDNIDHPVLPPDPVYKQIPCEDYDDLDEPRLPRFMWGS
jgi:hypothetical protein